MNRIHVLALVFVLMVSISLNISWGIWLYLNNNHENTIVKRSSEGLINTIVESIDITDLPTKIDPWNLATKDWEWFFIDKGMSKPLIYDKHSVTSVQLSPTQEKLGFFFRPEDHSLGNIVLSILDIDRKVIKEVYTGDNRTSNWEWKGDNHIIVKRSCGNGCMNAYVIDVITGEQIESYRVY